MTIRYILAASAVLAISACNSEPAEPDTNAAMADQQTADTGTAMAGQDAGAATAMTAQQFVDAAAGSDAYEVEAGRMASEMGTAESVKSFGAMMVEGHTKTTQDLTAAAGQASTTVSPAMNAKQQADIEALRNAGDAFDATYAAQQVAAHQTTLSMMRDYASSGDSQPLRDFATATAPVVEEHLTMARELP
jgi:putative membrane protein